MGTNIGGLLTDVLPQDARETAGKKTAFARQMNTHFAPNQRPTTRRFLRWAGMAFLAFTLVAGGALGTAFIQAEQSNVGELTFDNRLTIPPLMEPDEDPDGRKVFNLAFTAGESELVPGVRTPTWGLNGPYLSPTLRASRGDQVLVNVTNGVDEPTTLHWHGMRLPAAMDGGPHQMIEPGETWSPAWTIDQPAATLWFHPHPHGTTAEHVYRGAAGMFIVDDDESMTLGLPSDYGVNDIPLIIQDKRFRSDGSLDLRERWLPVKDSSTLDPLDRHGSLGILGDEILVNGARAPYFEATTTLVRFRVLNASNSRVFNLGFSDDRSFFMVGTDAGLVEAPAPLTRLQLSPGERAELVVEMTAGEEFLLRSFQSDFRTDPWTERMQGGHDVFDVMKVRAAPELVESPSLPQHLATIDRPAVETAVKTRSFVLEGHARINGQEFDMTRIDAAIEAGTVEIWEVRNSSALVHNFHVHLVHFLVLDVDGGPPPAHLDGWKDTILIPSGRTIRFIARFDIEPDPTRPFMFHCHILSHEDQGMMGQFVVIEPGTIAPSIIHELPGSHH